MSLLRPDELTLEQVRASLEFQRELERLLHVGCCRFVYRLDAQITAMLVDHHDAGAGPG